MPRNLRKRPTRDANEVHRATVAHAGEREIACGWPAFSETAHSRRAESEGHARSRQPGPHSRCSRRDVRATSAGPRWRYLPRALARSIVRLARASPDSYRVSREQYAQIFETAIEARLYSRKWRAKHGGDLHEAQFFLKAQQ